ncbi:hypothetical protein AGMMS49587_03550 [Spirochaetia bacterium]|nr:hypothetical protein AGMMS49587_03550 [Spirochaetia bacterium]
MTDINEKKEALIQRLSEQYAQNIISLEEYERMIAYLHKTETIKETNAIEKMAEENSITDTDVEKHVALFSWRSSNVVSLNEYLSQGM